MPIAPATLSLDLTAPEIEALKYLLTLGAETAAEHPDVPPRFGEVVRQVANKVAACLPTREQLHSSPGAAVEDEWTATLDRLLALFDSAPVARGGVWPVFWSRTGRITRRQPRGRSAIGFVASYRALLDLLAATGDPAIHSLPADTFPTLPGASRWRLSRHQRSWVWIRVDRCPAFDTLPSDAPL